jgi:hypothetical protein
MSIVRFSLVAIGVFAMAFVGISWASKGFPVMMMRVEPLKPDARLPTFEESVKKGLRKEWENSKTSQSDGNKERDQLRLDLLQASNAYGLSPCDATMKKNLVEAMTRYVSAWLEMAGCTPAFCGNEARLDAARVAFQTPADARVKEALRDAINKGGIGKSDFPKSIRDRAFMFTGMPFVIEANACHGGQQAGNTRR